MADKKKEHGIITKSNILFNSINALMNKEVNGKRVLKLVGNTFYTYPEIISGPSKVMFVKNLFYYLRLRKLIGPTATMYVKDIEEGTTIAEYSNKNEAVILTN